MILEKIFELFALRGWSSLKRSLVFCPFSCFLALVLSSDFSMAYSLSQGLSYQGFAPNQTLNSGGSEIQVPPSCQILGFRQVVEKASSRPSGGSLFSRPQGGEGGDLLPIPWGEEVQLESSQLRDLIEGYWTIAYPDCGTYLQIQIGSDSIGQVYFLLGEFVTATGQSLSSGFGRAFGNRLIFWVYSESARELFQVHIAIFYKQQFPKFYWDKDYFWCDQSDHVFILNLVDREGVVSFALKRLQ
jgi:hypothetical protein